MEVHQITYLHDNGPWDLVKAKSIRCLVGVIVELDHGHAGRDTKMIIGALREVAIAGIEQQHVGLVWGSVWVCGLQKGSILRLKILYIAVASITHQ